MRKQIKKELALLLIVAMMMGLVPVMAEPVPVQAETGTAKTIAGLGVSMIADPVNPGISVTQAWTGSYVYFGNYDADSDEKAEPV